MTGTRIAVVGGSLAGLRAAEQLRAVGHTGALTVFSAEHHPPYNRPPLSKEALSDPGQTSPADLAERLAFRRRASTADVDFRLGCEVVSSDLDRRRLVLGTGEEVEFDGLVAATGLRPRRVPVPGPLRGRHVLRTVEDCHGLRAAVQGAERAVVVGGGFIGTEVAATLHKLGLAVTVVVGPGGPLLARVLGTELSSAVQRHHERHGIRFVSGAGVTRFTGEDAATGVELDTGEVLEADVVVESIGSQCNVEWLEGNGLDLTNGVLADNHLRVVGASGVVVVGDLARFPNPLFDDVARRVEHWSIPTDTAKRAARSLGAALGVTDEDPTTFAPVPAFWSDQLDLRLQSYGSPSLSDEARIDEGSLDDLVAGVLVTYHRRGSLVGNVSVNLRPARHRELRDSLAPLTAA